MKKLINAPGEVVAQALIGFEAAHGDRLRVDHEQRTVLRRRLTPGKVGLLSGGGSGHEPLHSGFVGPGMLDAACAGEVFTSPVPDQVVAATSAVDTGAGVLHVVKNYTGDVMNFEMAAEISADLHGTRVASVLVADDVAVQDSLHTAGRRGTGLAVLLEKLVGAAAEQGRELDDLVSLAHGITARGRSMGVALSSCTVPAAGRPTFELGPDEIELGIGVHGEPGRERRRLVPAAELAELLVEPVLEELNAAGSPAIVLLNGLGSTPLLELYLMFGEVSRALERRGVRVVRSLVGNYITSLEMAGCSLTVLTADEELVGLWDAPVNTPALRWGA